LAAELENKLVTLRSRRIYVRGATGKFHARKPRAGVSQRKLWELNGCAGREAKRAAIFKLNLSAALTSTQLGAFGDWEIDNSFFELAGVAVNLHVAFYVAEADNSDMRIRECR